MALAGALLRATVLAPEDRSRPSGTEGAPSIGGTEDGFVGDPSCPARGHVDTKVSGLRPEDIPTLPGSYSFSHIAPDGCTPLRWNPCEPIHYVVNSTEAPATGTADVQEAFARMGEATGMTFVDDGATDETGRDRQARPYVPERYGERWAPVLVVWAHQGNRPGDIEVVGGGFPVRVGDVYVSGSLYLNVDAVTDPATRAPLEGGFGPPVGSGSGPIGPAGVTWGRVILHELAHVMGLGHTRDRSQLMYPDTAEQTFRPTRFGESDLAGLRQLGRSAGCLTTPRPG